MGSDILVLLRSNGPSTDCLVLFNFRSLGKARPSNGSLKGFNFLSFPGIIAAHGNELCLVITPLQQSSGMTLPLAPETACPNFPVLLCVFNFEKQLSALFPYHDFYVSSIYFGYTIKLTSSSYCRLGPLQLSSTKFVYKQEGAGGECLISSSVKLTIA